MARPLELRDCEIIRTLGRLRYLTTAEIIATFFSVPPNGRRRLSVLADLGYITSHTKGLPSRANRVWRLTPRGLEMLDRDFPEEIVPDGLADRLADASLSNLDHREAVNQLYLDFLRHGIPRGSENDRDAGRRNVQIMRGRAAQMDWAPDGDVVLRVEDLGDVHQIVPDATVQGRRRPVVVFVEVDRSTRSLRRIEENLERYRRSFADTCGGLYPKRRPSLLYVVRSKARAEGIAKCASAILDRSVTWTVRLHADAVAWLDSHVIEKDAALVASAAGTSVPSRPTSARPPGVDIAAELFTICASHLKTCSTRLPPPELHRLHELRADLSRLLGEAA